MELQTLRLYVLCAKYLSFSRVAELSYMSQPSVSKYISALEAEVEGELFVRGGRKLELTALGEAMLPYVEELLYKEDELRGFLHQYHNGDDIHPLVIGISDTLSDSPADHLLLPLTHTASQFRELHVGTDLKIRHFQEQSMKELVLSGRIDLAMIAVNNSHIGEHLGPDFDFLRLDEADNCIFYAPSLGEFNSIQELLPRLDSLLTVSDHIAMSVAYDFLKKVRVPLRVEPCDNWHDAIIRTCNGQGATILNTVTAQFAQQCGLSFLPLDEYDITTSALAVWRRGGNHMLADFAGLLRSNIASERGARESK